MKNLTVLRNVTMFLSLTATFLTAAALAAPNEQPVPYTGLPYRGAPLAIPGTLQIEEYDIAPEAANGISFNYNNPATKTPLRTSNDSIGLARFGDGHVTIKGEPENADQVYAGWTHTGEWFKYTIRVGEAGTYRIGGHFSAAGTTATISVAANGETTGPLAIPTTAGYQPNVEVYHVWEKLDDVGEVRLPRGDVVLTVKIENGDGLNLDYLTFSKK